MSETEPIDMTSSGQSLATAGWYRCGGGKKFHHFLGGSVFPVCGITHFRGREATGSPAESEKCKLCQAGLVS